MLVKSSNNVFTYFTSLNYFFGFKFISRVKAEIDDLI